MASILKVDTITGVSTAGSIAVTGEGNSTTTNLQQGLAKVWAKATQSDNSIYDSFNLTSITDDGTGQLTFTIASDVANINYGFTSTTQVTDCGGLNATGTGATTTGTAVHQGRNSSGTDVDSNPVSIVIHGDLA